MVQELLIRKTTTMTILQRKNWIVNKCLFVILLLITAGPAAQSQSSNAIVSKALKIVHVKVTNESVSGLIDGKIAIAIKDDSPKRSTYRLSYDFLAEGNHFVSKELTAVNGVITLENARIGGYYNLRVIRTADQLTSKTADAFSLKNATVYNSSGFAETTSSATCSSTLHYVNCAGSNKSISNAVTDKAYNDENDFRPCGFEVSAGCSITGINRWHCIDGNKSVPPVNNRYTITDYAGVGISALAACRINWIVCNYNYKASNVDDAIWYLTGTGGSNNSIAQAAAAAVPAVNGTQNLMVFYKSDNNSYQNMIKWSCVNNSGCNARVTGLYFNELNNGPDLPITNGAIFTLAQLGSLYNLEASTSGTAGSVRFSITGPTASSNTENDVPYNSPSTGSGAWTGAAGNYSVNIKAYSGSNASGTLCHDTTITFIVSQSSSPCTIGGVNLGNLTNYLYVFTNGSYEAKWQSASKGHIGDVAVDGIEANEATSGSFAYAGTIYSNSSTLSNWQDIVDNNTGQAFSSLNQTSRISGLETDLNNAFTQINALPVSPGYNGIHSTSLNGLNTTNNIAERFVINVTSGFGISSKINITGDPGDVFIFRWDDDADFSNGYDGQVKFQSGGAIVPLGGLKPSNFIHVAGDIDASGGGSNPASPYPQGPRTNNGTGSLITGGADFSGGGFFTGYWLTTGKPSDGRTSDLSNAIFVGGWYSSSVKFKMTSGTSGVYVAPVCGGGGTGSIGDRVWNDANNNGLQDPAETGGIAGVTIQLRNAGGNVIAATESGTNGSYLFPNLPAGTYTVVFPTTFAGGALSPAKVGSNDNIDSDPSQATGATGNIVLATGQNITTVDAGYFGFVGLTLGNKVFFDANRSGMFDAGDGPMPNTVVRLYKDDNNDNIADGAAIAITTTDANGIYKFENLAPGNYIVGAEIPASYAITVVDGGDPDSNIDNDNNATAKIGTEARGMAITLSFGAEPDAGGNTNNSYDIGLYNPLAPPNGGQNCFAGVNPLVFAKSYWTVNANTQTVTLRVTFAKSFVDNCYKATGNADNWNRSHTFANLTGSDHLQWSIRDANGLEKLSFKQDYISASNTFPSGYGTLGFGGDGGTPTVGNAADVLSFRTSISTNFNDFGYVLLNDSPPTDSNYTPNPAAPNWIYDTWYEVTIKASLFGNIGFGSVNVASVHASPSKTGNNTETITNNPCASGSIGDRVWNDINKNGTQDAGEVGISGIIVSLYDGSTNKVLASTITDGYGNYKFSNLETSISGVDYQVRFSLAPGYRFSPSAGAVTSAVNSDANVLTGRTGTITLTNAVPNVTYADAGMYYTQTARLGDFVWNDMNKDGIQDAGEPGIAGVTVMLYTSANVLYRSTITSNNGYYFFNDVPAGSYYIKVAPPIGYQVSPKNTGAGNVDSDIDPVTRKTGNIVVVAGTNDLTIDAGLNVTATTGASASLGDKVWEDLNNNNIQDAGEPGVANVTVELFNSSNVSQGTITTDAFGNYIFNGLIPGSYYVKFTLPPGYSYVTANTGTNDGIDSDADGTGTTQTVTLAADEINTTVDAGLRRTTTGATLGDYVWYDLNKNGVQDGGNEVGVPGITVLLYNSSNVVISTTTTDINGFYLFTGLAAGTYTVGFENIPAGYGFSPNAGAVTVANNSDVNPSTGRTGNIAVAAGSDNRFVDAGLISTPKTFDSKASVGDKVWNDLNNNGIQDAGEPGIPGVTVTLYAANGTTVVATTTTDALGNYLFTNLDAGSYVVGFSGLPTGYVFSSKDAGTDDSKDSDADTGSGKTAPFTLAPGEINLTIDAGARNANTALSNLGNFVWYDLNNNGIQDAGEPGAAGISARLTNMSGLIVGTTTTSATGEYLFTDLPAGNYFVEFGNLPVGYSLAIKNAPASTSANNSDANIATSKTDIIILPAATTDLNWDMGIVSTTRASLGDFVWNDLNNDGIQNIGEPGVAGVTVTLYDNNNVAVSQTVTDNTGFYFFSNLLPGTYNVGFSNIPASSSFTTQNAAGGTAANNSDADPATGRTANFSLVAGQSKTDVDAGLVSLKAAVGDYVWHDIDRNGIQDPTEVGVAGVTVTMYRSNDVIIGNGDDVAVASAVTNANGYYFINDVPAAIGGSQYYMRYTDVQTSFTTFTTPLVGGAGASDNSKVTSMPLSGGRSGFFTLNPGQVYRDMDAGVYKQLSLSGNVWHDVNGMTDNLVNNSGAAQVPPAIVIPTGMRISQVDAVTGRVVSVALVQGNGMYNFPNVDPGNYILVLSTIPGTPGQLAPFASVPQGWVNTGENLGLQPGRDAVINGKLSVSVTSANVTNANFGIQLNNDDIGIN